MLSSSYRKSPIISNVEVVRDWEAVGASKSPHVQASGRIQQNEPLCATCAEKGADSAAESAVLPVLNTRCLTSILPETAPTAEQSTAYPCQYHCSGNGIRDNTTTTALPRNASDIRGLGSNRRPTAYSGVPASFSTRLRHPHPCWLLATGTVVQENCCCCQQAAPLTSSDEAGQGKTDQDAVIGS